MQEKHLEIVQARLREAGISSDDYRQGPDLPSYMTLKELQMVTTFAMRYAMNEVGFLDDRVQIGIHIRDRGADSTSPAPWLEFSVGERKFAIWRHTGDLYAVELDGSVGDEPLHRRD
jgi:hypothetical protein